MPITDAQGSLLAQLSFDAFSKRRRSNLTGNPSAAEQAVIARPDTPHRSSRSSPFSIRSPGQHSRGSDHVKIIQVEPTGDFGDDQFKL